MSEAPRGWLIWEKNRENLLKLATSRPCPVCGGDGYRHYFRGQCGYNYCICTACGMVYIREVITAATWSEIYSTNDDYKDYMETYTLRPLVGHTECKPENVGRFSGYFDRIMSCTGLDRLTGLRYLDLGTFDGDAMVVARDNYGMEPYGIEARNEIADLISRTRNLRIAGAVSDDMDVNAFGGKFQIVSAFESLEHSYDPVETLARAYDMMEEWGVMIATVPNADNLELRTLLEYSPHCSGGLIGPGHINLFNSETMRKIFRERGFEVVEMFSEFNSSLRNVYHYLMGRYEFIPCYSSILEGVYREEPEDVTHLQGLDAIHSVFSAWENSRLNGPILGIVAIKPGSQPRAMVADIRNAGYAPIEEENLAWLAAGAVVSGGELRISGNIPAPCSYVAIFKAVELNAGAVVKIGGVLKVGGVNLGLQRDKSWYTQKAIDQVGRFEVELHVEEDGEYSIILANNLPELSDYNYLKKFGPLDRNDFLIDRIGIFGQV